MRNKPLPKKDLPEHLGKLLKNESLMNSIRAIHSENEEVYRNELEKIIMNRFATQNKELISTLYSAINIGLRYINSSPTDAMRDWKQVLAAEKQLSDLAAKDELPPPLPPLGEEITLKHAEAKKWPSMAKRKLESLSGTASSYEPEFKRNSGSMRLNPQKASLEGLLKFTEKLEENFNQFYNSNGPIAYTPPSQNESPKKQGWLAKIQEAEKEKKINMICDALKLTDLIKAVETIIYDTVSKPTSENVSDTRQLVSQVIDNLKTQPEKFKKMWTGKKSSTISAAKEAISRTIKNLDNLVQTLDAKLEKMQTNKMEKK